MRDGISFVELVRATGSDRFVDRLIEDAYAACEEKILREELDSAPQGEPWHVSFHASSFPAGRERYCGRAAMYSLMDVPTPGEVDPTGRAIMDAGKDLESQIVSRLHQFGVLLSEPPLAKYQTGFDVPELWLTGSCDAVVQPHGWNRGHVIECKGKDHDAVLALQRRETEPDPYHMAQCRCYVWLARRFSHALWPGLEPVRSGTLLYVSRQRPRTTAEFYVEFDPEFVAEGAVQLRDWIDAFRAGELPTRPTTWRWTEDPCDYCPWKRDVCRVDERNDAVKIKDSELTNFAKQHVPTWDYDEKRKAVLQRWGAEDAEGS